MNCLVMLNHLQFPTCVILSTRCILKLLTCKTVESVEIVRHLAQAHFLLEDFWAPWSWEFPSVFVPISLYYLCTHSLLWIKSLLRRDLFVLWSMEHSSGHEVSVLHEHLLNEWGERMSASKALRTKGCCWIEPQAEPWGCLITQRAGGIFGDPFLLQTPRYGKGHIKSWHPGQPSRWPLDM